MPYSLVTQPFPLPFRNPGTPSVTVAVLITRVFPSSINTLPSAWEIKSGVIFKLRNWSACRPSLRIASLFSISRKLSVVLLPLCRPAHCVHCFADRRRQLRTWGRRIIQLGARGVFGINTEQLRQVHVARQRIRFLAVNQNFQAEHLRHVGFERAHDGL